MDETGHFPTQQAIKAIIKKSENDSCVMKINKKCAAASQYGCYRWMQVGEAYRSNERKSYEEMYWALEEARRGVCWHRDELLDTQHDGATTASPE